MPTRTRLILSIVILLLAALVLVLPTGVRAALEHNLWSLAAAEAAFGDDTAPEPLSNAHPHAYQWLARLALLKGDTGAAFNWLSQLGDPRDNYALNTLAQTYYQDGQPLAAFELWREIGFTSQLVNAGKAALDAGDLALAAQAYRAAYEADPEGYTHALASFLWRQEKDQEAQALLEDALDTYIWSDHRSAWWRLLGDIRRDQGDSQGEEAAYLSASVDDPTDYNAWISLGWLVYDDTGDAEAAIAYFKEAIRVAPGRSDGYQAVGQIWVREEQPLQALEWYQKASELNPGRLSLVLTYANLLSSTDQFELALVEYEMAIERHPDSWWPYYHLALAFWQHDDPEQAIQAIEKASLLNPNDVRIFNRAGWMYEELGRLDAALAAFQHALRLRPNDSTAQRGVERLAGEE